MSSQSKLTQRHILWILVPLVAFGGIFFPRLGLLVLGVMAALLITGLLRGKYWCGNLCPHGSMFDIILKKVSFNRDIPDIFHSAYLKWGFFVFFMGMFIFRFIRVLQLRGTEQFINSLGSMFVLQYLIMPTILGISLAVLISPRTWCVFCPMGTLTQIMSKAGKKLGINQIQKVTINNREACRECGACAQACPLELEPYKNFDDNDQFSDSRCMQCGECVEACPFDLMEIK